MIPVFQVKVPQTRFSVEQRGQFTIIGNGQFGGKAKDLMEKQDAIVKAGFLVPPSVILTTEFFTALYETARQRVEGRVTRAKLLEALVNTDFDPEAMAVLNAMANPELWLGVRSSQLKEHGGTGQYLSGFCRGVIGRREKKWHINETEADPLDVLIKKVVASSGNEDMAVLIQPVVGEQREWDATPDAAGWAYTTRLQQGGEGKICFVRGLGTKAVMSGGYVFFFGDNGLRMTERDPSPSIFHLVRPSGVEWEYGGIDEETGELLERELPPRLKALERLLGTPQYIEFALSEGNIYCLQCADTIPIAEERLDKDITGKVLANSTIVNTVTQRELQDVIWTYGQDPTGSIHDLVAQTTGRYLLVIPSSIFSGATPYERINKAMVPNVGGIVVVAVHSGGNVVAGEHVRNGFGRDMPFMVVTDFGLLNHFERNAIENGNWRLARGKFALDVNEAIGLGKLTYVG